MNLKNISDAVEWTPVYVATQFLTMKDDVVRGFVTEKIYNDWKASKEPGLCFIVKAPAEPQDSYIIRLGDHDIEWSEDTLVQAHKYYGECSADSRHDIGHDRRAINL